jgi:hypothetical protein
MWLSWIDNCLNLEADNHVNHAVAEIKTRFDCDEVNELSIVYIDLLSTAY